MVYPVSVSLVIICIVHNKCTIRSLASIYVLVSCIDYIRSPAMAWYYVSRTRHLGRNCNSQFSGRDWSLPYAMPTWRIAYHPPILRSVSRPVLPASIFLVFNSNSEGLSARVFIRGYNDWLFFSYSYLTESVTADWKSRIEATGEILQACAFLCSTQRFGSNERLDASWVYYF